MIALATLDDALPLATLHNAVAQRLTDQHGQGPWSGVTTEKGVRYALRTSRVYVAREGERIVATFRLATKNPGHWPGSPSNQCPQGQVRRGKPWAIDIDYFAPVRRPLYLLGMAVAPGRQRSGVGRQCLADARTVAREWPADAIRLDAWDADAGAGGFYVRCGYTEVGRRTYRGNGLIYFEQCLGTSPGSDSPESRRPNRS